MKKLNLLNRFALWLYWLMHLVLIACGVISIVYRKRRQEFTAKWSLQVFAYTLLLASAAVTLVFVSVTYLLIRIDSYRGLSEIFHCIRELSRYSICLFARLYLCVYEKELLAILNELHDIHRELQVLARHPNFFRWSHLILCLFALQSFVRSLDDVLTVYEVKSVVFCYVIILLVAVFIMTITILMMILIGLSAFYDELQRCTRKASNDVRTLRLGTYMASGQRSVLVEQLRLYIEQLIAVRARMFTVTMRLIKHFRLHFILAIVYWLCYEITVFIQMPSLYYALYKVSVGLLNIAFYCTIFEIFVWKSQLSRSFWNFHLLNYNTQFDRTIDELLYRELVEHVKVSAYGLRLDKRLFCKILLLTFVYILMHIVYKRKW